LCADVLRTVLAEHELLLSPSVIEELRRTLVEKIGVPEQTVRDIVTFLRASASVLDVTTPAAPVEVRDPDDAVILAEALAGNADVLVTGDKDLLDLGAVRGVRILDPRGFWQLIRRRVPGASERIRWRRPRRRSVAIADEG
jgi:putative PIN family toxin of toxin-antitoxin system